MVGSWLQCQAVGFYRSSSVIQETPEWIVRTDHNILQHHTELITQEVIICLVSGVALALMLC